ncbi:putative arabinosyltransferase C [Tsukamurella sp. TY48]|uniref:arabinosyltransferase domain-containing protein n=1 Tax=Tsukamurella sp. TY48 TaxID=2775495 RepID=UPI00208B96FD|nr:arabinosyltransferase domain-containing protein [Tsukamurella sp. TY48]GIZ97314.1 putative arabinosyltransferase C [Tsukamurella sp. TY48]
MPEPSTAQRAARTTAWTAALTGVLGVLFALLTPFMPVKQATAALDWPQRGTLESVAAPLVSYVPDRLDVRVPCSAVGRLPGGVGTLVATGPVDSPDTLRRGLSIAVAGAADAPPEQRRLEVIVRNTPLLSVPVSELANPACGEIVFTGDAERVQAEVTGLKAADGTPLAGGKENGFDYRPQTVGAFTQLTGPVTAETAIRFHATIDTRYTTTPSILRWITILLAVGLILASLVTLHRLDVAADGRRHRRVLPEGWWRPSKLDSTVLAVLAAWHFIGANTSDDGYILTMARAASEAGYTANYYRWYGAPETPFGWYYQAFAWLDDISPASPWVRLPALLCGIATWLIISREVVPRLGRAARSSTTLWAAGGVFLIYWMAFNNGLRPEPVIALGALLTWCSVERAIATGRVLPFAAAAIVAGWTVAAGPTGIMTVAALLAGVRPVGRRILHRARTGPVGFRLGLIANAAPVFAGGVLLVPIIFSKLTAAAFFAKTAMQSSVGTVVDTKKWYNEIDRYSALFTFTADGGVARRFAVLITLLCLLLAGAVLLRKGRVPGTSLGPGRRVVAVTFGGLLLLMFTPTKWTHQFGAFAGLAGALAALTAVAIAPVAMRNPRNRAITAASVFFVLGLSFSGPNGWWYASNYGVPWGTSTVLALGTVFFVASVLSVFAAGWLHFHEPQQAPAPALVTRIVGFFGRQSPITWASGAVVVLCVGTLTATTVLTQFSSYSVGKGNLRALVGEECNMADFVLTEPDATGGLLTPIGGDVRGGLAGPGTVGVTPDGVPPVINATTSSGTDDSSTSLDAMVRLPQETTSGRTDRAGINGSHMKLPYDLDPARTPVLGSYSAEQQERAKIVSQWYPLPTGDDRPLLTMSAAGRFTDDELYLEYTTAPPTGPDLPVAGKKGFIDIGPKPAWRNLRLPRTDLPDGVTAVRLVAIDDDLAIDHWLAVTPPRMSKLVTAQQLIGSTDPVLVDWTSGLSFTCQRPFLHRDGVAEVPQWRITPDQNLSPVTTEWEGTLGGGPVGWTQMLLRQEKVPAYLKGDLGQDFGEVMRLTPYTPARPADLTVGSRTVWGTHVEAPIRKDKTDS